MTVIDSVLVANRGEIAVRIIRACRDLGLRSVAVYSDIDATALHVRLADEAVRIGPAPASESYLRIGAILAAARSSGAVAIHPGYGFLSERAEFARACEAAGRIFVGPSSATIAALGNKLAARRLATDAGVPVVPGSIEPAPVGRPDQVAGIVARAREIGFPVMVKAAAGGGGRGMRLVANERELPAALAAGSAEAASAFGDGSVYLERVIRPARHVEVQLLGDGMGHVIALGERDCSIQRRHQKLVEEAPAPALDPERRARLHALAVSLGRAAGLRNAATAEFLLDPSGGMWFLEVNTRLQVEHGVTELVSGVDLVREQLQLAMGEPLSAAARAAADAASRPGSHAIEVRIAAEDPSRAFAPAPGVVARWRAPSGPGVRVDSGIEAGDRIPPEYDNLLAKVLAYGHDRTAAIARLARALEELDVAGVQTTLPFHRFVAAEPDFRAGLLSTDYVEQHWDAAADRARALQAGQIAAALGALAPLRPGGSGRWVDRRVRRRSIGGRRCRSAGCGPGGSR